MIFRSEESDLLELIFEFEDEEVSSEESSEMTPVPK